MRVDPVDQRDILRMGFRLVLSLAVLYVALHFIVKFW
jgi:hypothetical protein